MPTSVESSPLFRRHLRRLRRKYPKVEDEIEKFSGELEQDARPGDQIPDVGYEAYKVRLPNPSAKRGKSGGFRVIYYVQLVDRVILLDIYSKTDQADIPPERITQMIEDLVDEEGDNPEE